MTKTIPKKKKRKKADCLSEEALQIAEKRKEVKGKGERERYTNMQKKGKECNRMGKTRDLVNKTGDIKGTFHAKMCMI